MVTTFRHGVRELRRESRERAFGLGRDAQARWYAAQGNGECAILAHAQAIRFARAYRESARAYRRLDALLRRFGDCDTGLAATADTPARFVGFVGYSRSGHSLVGSLLDAHPDAVIAHEVHAFKHLARGVPFDRVVRALQQNARIFQIMGRNYTGYDYAIPDQWQGTARHLTVVGDKKGNGTARLLRCDPGALARIRARIPVPIHFIHVIRNPYDNIATKALRTGRSLDRAAAVYFANAREIGTLKARGDVAVHDLHLDRIIAEPRGELTRLLDALGLDTEVPGYLDACAEILFSAPNRTRDRVVWPAPLVAHIERELAARPFTRPYAGHPPTPANLKSA